MKDGEASRNLIQSPRAADNDGSLTDWRAESLHWPSESLKDSI